MSISTNRIPGGSRPHSSDGYLCHPSPSVIMARMKLFLLSSPSCNAAIHTHARAS